MKKSVKKIVEYSSSVIFYLTILILFAALNFRDNPSNGWSLQVLPSLNIYSINDVVFLDSLTGFFVTTYSTNNLGSIYKSTNGGNNWIEKKSNIYPFTRIMFYSSTSGFCSSWDTLFKTTDKGENWIAVPNSFGFWIYDFYALDENNIWVVDQNGLTGGLFRTTDGGQNWIRQFYSFQENPDKIYMINKDIGFMGRGAWTYLARTTDGGYNWSINYGDTSFFSMNFIDSAIGFMSGTTAKKTTNSGLSWNNYELPKVPNVATNHKVILSYSIINKDTIFGVGGYYAQTSQSLAIPLVYKTTNGGLNWGYQIPDTNFMLRSLYFIDFINKGIGWAFRYKEKSIKTISGGSDTTFYTDINNNAVTELPKDFELFQNYPNPFNQFTVIKIQCKIKSKMQLKVFDIAGKEIITLLNEEKPAGIYSIRFDSGELTSGVYFYQLISNGKSTGTKKMIILR